MQLIQTEKHVQMSAAGRKLIKPEYQRQDKNNG